jgi:hypothetical protein
MLHLMNAPSTEASRPRILTLTAFGTPAAVIDLLRARGPELASAMGLTLRTLSPETPPNLALQAIRDPGSQGSGRLLLTIPQDPGVPLPGGGCWAEILGAWRQPTLVILSAEQLSTGWPAAATALLQHHRVPLVGLIQSSGHWDAEKRRQDGLPWLGPVNGDGEASDRTQAAVMDRWQGTVRTLL